MSSGHSAEDAVKQAIWEDDGEYFDEDPTVGRGVPQDPAGAKDWPPFKPKPVSAGFTAAIQASLPAPSV